MLFSLTTFFFFACVFFAAGRVYRAVSYQEPSLLAPLFRLSGIMSSNSEVAGRGVFYAARVIVSTHYVVKGK
jgi:hypothetical protein